MMERKMLKMEVKREEMESVTEDIVAVGFLVVALLGRVVDLWRVGRGIWCLFGVSWSCCG